MGQLIYSTIRYGAMEQPIDFINFYVAIEQPIYCMNHYGF